MEIPPRSARPLKPPYIGGRCLQAPMARFEDSRIRGSPKGCRNGASSISTTTAAATSRSAPLAEKRVRDYANALTTEKLAPILSSSCLAAMLHKRLQLVMPYLAMTCWY